MSALKVIIDSGDQTLRVMRAGSSIFEALVSTSQYGLGYEPGSLKTPTGLFHIAEKIGQESPLGTVFKGRVPVSEPIDWENEPDLITSRILWLDGLHEANANTKDRYIYIHGTNEEKLLGRPASFGCIRMRSTDVAALYNQLPLGTPVEIVQDRLPKASNLADPEVYGFDTPASASGLRKDKDNSQIKVASGPHA